MKLRLQNLERIYKQLIMMLVDAFTIVFALWLAFLFRQPKELLDFVFQSWWLFFATPIVMVLLFVKLGLYRAVLQYIGIKVITTTFQATTIACLIIGFLMMFFRESNQEFSLPRSVLPIFRFIEKTF